MPPALSGVTQPVRHYLPSPSRGAGTTPAASGSASPPRSFIEMGGEEKEEQEESDHEDISLAEVAPVPVVVSPDEEVEEIEVVESKPG